MFLLVFFIHESDRLGKVGSFKFSFLINVLCSVRFLFDFSLEIEIVT